MTEVEALAANMFAAAEAGDADCLESLLAALGEGRLVNFAKEVGLPGFVLIEELLCKAAERGHVSAMEVCVAHGARDRDTALKKAIHNKHPQAADYCLNGPFPGALSAFALEGALIWAARWDASIMPLCVRRGARDFNTALFYAASEDNLAGCETCVAWGALDFKPALAVAGPAARAWLEEVASKGFAPHWAPGAERSDPGAR